MASVKTGALDLEILANLLETFRIVVYVVCAEVGLDSGMIVIVNGTVKEWKMAIE